MALTSDERPDARRRREFSYYVVALVVFPLRAVPALSWAFVIYSLLLGNVRSVKFLLASCEAVFYLYYVYLSNLASRPKLDTGNNLAQLQMIYTRVLRAGMANYPEDGSEADRPGKLRVQCIQIALAMLTHPQWFNRVPFSQIRRLEVQRWIYWSIFNKHLPEVVPPAHQIIIDDALNSLEMRLGAKVTEGADPANPPMRISLDPLVITARPFLVYALVSSINWCLRKWYGYQHQIHHGVYEDLEYLVYIPEGWDVDTGPRPTVFFHGLGVGLLQYHHLMMDLRYQFPDRPLLFPLQPHISQAVFHPKFLDPPCRQEFADLIAGLLHKLGWVEWSPTDDDLSRDARLTPANRTVNVLSHSNGAYLHTWCLKWYPELFSRSCLADPASLCLWEGDLCYNFLYKQPTNGVELVTRYVIAQEVGTAALMYRNFDWATNALWYENIPNARDPSKTIFLLGGKDALINTQRAKTYLTSHGISEGLWYDPEGEHGSALRSGGEGHKLILKWLRDGQA
ncbi:hypothetical protein HMN09_01223100 [Mycena chlorophos]|uniref:Uncharacterized protein n=1 Tax=Mycena chlorophos TaxID=658473 RepID=A0A8H6S6U5_MYCCL|nr:hypothetical protein HMN09_01223100 [Mycena chlorophos]